MGIELTLRVMAGCLFALILYHGFIAGIRIYLRSETKNAMRGLAFSGIIALFGGSMIYLALTVN